jgi:hypothetical protein
MEIRLRSTGEVMLEDQFRRYQKENSGPTWDRTTDEVLEALGADVVFEGAQATLTEFWQYSQRSGVEQVNGKWYTKYIPGPVFTDTEDATAAEQLASYIASKQAEKDKADREALKMTGILIEGVMCSATKDDQNGLSAVALGVTLARASNKAFPDTVFKFANGNSLVITDANFNTVYALWVPFRQSFFKP